MMHILIDILPTALGFLGFFLFRRYFMTNKKATGKKAEWAGSPKEEIDDHIEHIEEPAPEVDSEPEPGPEPDLSDETPKRRSSAARLEGGLSGLPLHATPEKSTSRTGSIAAKCGGAVVIGAYLLITAGVFIHFCTETPADDAAAVSSTATQVSIQTGEALQEHLQSARARLDLPYWSAGEQEAQHVEPNADQIVTVPLNRQFMTLRSAEGMVIYYKSAYWGELSVGTPLETFKVVFDTGSGHLILPSTYCRSETCRVHKRFKRSASLTAKDIDHDGSIVSPGTPRDQITVSFGTGEVTGVFIDDFICLDNSTLPPLPEKSQDEASNKANESAEGAIDDDWAPGCFKLRLVLATVMSEDPFRDFHFDGVLGLGLSALSQAYEFNFPGMMSNLVRKLGAPLPHTFAVFLAMHEGETSELSMGGYSRGRQGGPLHWSRVILPEHGHWMISIKSVYVDGEEVEFCKDGTCRAVADTGTSLLAVPSGAFPEIYEMLRHNAPIAGFCNDTGPALQFELRGENGDNFTVSMRPEDYASLEPITKPTNTTREWFKRFFYANGWPKVKQPQENFRRDMYCKPLLMSMDLPEPLGPKLFILGEPILRRYYTVYNAEVPSIGWSQAVHTEPKEEEAEEESDEWWDAEEELDDAGKEDQQAKVAELEKRLALMQRGKSATTIQMTR